MEVLGLDGSVRFFHVVRGEVYSDLWAAAHLRLRVAAEMREEKKY